MTAAPARSTSPTRPTDSTAGLRRQPAAHDRRPDHAHASGARSAPGSAPSPPSSTWATCATASRSPSATASWAAARAASPACPRRCRPRPGASSNPYNQLFPLQDSAADAAPDAANTLKVTFDIGGCMRANGIDPTGQQIRLPLRPSPSRAPAAPTARPRRSPSACPAARRPRRRPATARPVRGSGAKPDLAIESVTGSDVGGDCEITAQVVNRGTAEASPTDTRVVVAGSPADRAPDPEHPRGRRADRQRPDPRQRLRGPDVHADRRRRARVDENSETNNTWSGAL